MWIAPWRSRSSRQTRACAALGRVTREREPTAKGMLAGMHRWLGLLLISCGARTPSQPGVPPPTVRVPDVDPDPASDEASRQCTTMYDESKREHEVCLFLARPIAWQVGQFAVRGFATAARDGTELERFDFQRIEGRDSGWRDPGGEPASVSLVFMADGSKPRAGTTCRSGNEKPSFVLCEVCFTAVGCLANDLARPDASGGGW